MSDSDSLQNLYYNFIGKIFICLQMIFNHAVKFGNINFGTIEIEAITLWFLAEIAPLEKQLNTVTVTYLDKAHTNSTHLSQLIDSFKSMIYRTRQQGSELLIIEYLQAAA